MANFFDEFEISDDLFDDTPSESLSVKMNLEHEQTDYISSDDITDKKEPTPNDAIEQANPEDESIENGDSVNTTEEIVLLTDTPKRKRKRRKKKKSQPQSSEYADDNVFVTPFEDDPEAKSNDSNELKGSNLADNALNPSSLAGEKAETTEIVEEFLSDNSKENDDIFADDAFGEKIQNQIECVVENNETVDNNTDSVHEVPLEQSFEPIIEKPESTVVGNSEDADESIFDSSLSDLNQNAETDTFFDSDSEINIVESNSDDQTFNYDKSLFDSDEINNKDENISDLVIEDQTPLNENETIISNVGVEETFDDMTSDFDDDFTVEEHVDESVDNLHFSTDNIQSTPYDEDIPDDNLTFNDDTGYQDYPSDGNINKMYQASFFNISDFSSSSPKKLLRIQKKFSDKKEKEKKKKIKKYKRRIRWITTALSFITILIVAFVVLYKFSPDILREAFPSFSQYILPSNVSPSDELKLYVYSDTEDNNVEKIVMPNLIGENYALINEDLKYQDFDLKIIREEYSQEYDKGTIMSQAVKEGQKIVKNSPVGVIVSLGDVKEALLSLEGKSVEDAKAILEGAGLYLGEQVEEYNSDVPAYQIVSVIESEDEIQVGSFINVIVSLGSDPNGNDAGISNTTSFSESTTTKKVVRSSMTTTINSTTTTKPTTATSKVTTTPSSESASKEENISQGVYSVSNEQIEADNVEIDISISK